MLELLGARKGAELCHKARKQLIFGGHLTLQRRNPPQRAPWLTLSSPVVRDPPFLVTVSVCWTRLLLLVGPCSGIVGALGVLDNLVGSLW